MQLTDNKQEYKLTDEEVKKDVPNLSLIANRNIDKLMQGDTDLLIFPHSFQQSKDKIGNGQVLSLLRDADGHKITTYNIMGFIGINDTQLSITSRFAENHKTEGDYFLHYLLSKVFAINLFQLEHEVNEQSIFDFLIYLFPRYLNEALSQGLYKEYQRREYNDANVRGTIDVSQHIRRNVPFNGRIAYRTREFSYDNDMTQLIRHTIEYIRTHRLGYAVLNGHDTETFVRQIVEATPSYTSRDRQQVINRNLRPKRHPYYQKYAELQRLCLQILRHEELKYGQAKDKVCGILFDGAWLWEEYLAILMKEVGFKHSENKEGKGRIYLFEKDDKGIYKKHYRFPDYYKDEEVWDAKYKHLSADTSIDRNDMHQLITYMHHFKAKQGGFICPRKDATETSKKLIGTLRGHGGDVYVLTFGIPTCDKWELFCQEMEEMEREMKLQFT
jgi:5-methylcytosine-specific restriction endonuclease McrBC regulatory subunit McrC